ncbi:hypothetical protein A0H81_07267 [Grifola frondosa]|uniref:Uncharacterized protein n=1 Tax=Grifola frondosa TaxID=5627 RepID=A0A1C7M8W5_GRIFR|nr:hypothetical protein A0H81_07267 [Grifola frondosa]
MSRPGLGLPWQHIREVWIGECDAGTLLFYPLPTPESPYPNLEAILVFDRTLRDSFLYNGSTGSPTQSMQCFPKLRTLRVVWIRTSPDISLSVGSYDLKFQAQHRACTRLPFTHLVIEFAAWRRGAMGRVAEDVESFFDSVRYKIFDGTISPKLPYT